MIFTPFDNWKRSQLTFNILDAYSKNVIYSLTKSAVIMKKRICTTYIINIHEVLLMNPEIFIL